MGSVSVKLRLSIWLTLPVFVAGCIRQPALEPAIVTGPSMGHRFPGEHRKANCPDCNYPIVCDAAQGPDSGRAFCPMCGCMKLEWEQMPVVPGMHCEIDVSHRQPNRWDVVAIGLPEPETGREFGIKRVIGLPGETVLFRDGDLFIDGVIVGKPVQVQRDLWQPVFDSAWMPVGNNLMDRFSPDEDESGVENDFWRSEGSRLAFEPGNLAENLVTLSYIHRPGYPHSGQQASDCLIRDHYSYNQGVSSTMLPVRDLAVEMLIDGDVGAGLVLDFSLSEEFSIAVRIGFENGDRISISVDQPDSGVVTVAQADRRVSLLVSVIDRCCLVQLDGQTVLELPLERMSLAKPNTGPEQNFPLPQLAIGAWGGNLEIARIRIWRDTMLVWADPFDGTFDEGREVTIPPGNYFVVGDNLPVSRDSRNWPAVFVPEGKILGLVKSAK